MPVRTITVAAALVAAPAAAESLLVQGMGRAVGWPVYDSAGRLGFTDCSGRSQALAEGGGLRTADRKCPGRPSPFRLVGRLGGVEPDRRRLELQVDGGGRRVLYLGPEAAAALGALPPGTPVEVEGPVDGHAATARDRS